MFKILKFCYFSLLFMVIILAAHEVSGQTPGRIWPAAPTLPSVRPKGFTEYDYFVVTGDKKTYQWKGGGWIVSPTIQLLQVGSKGDKGDKGDPGIPGTPGSGAGGFVESYGGVRWVNTRAKWSAALREANEGKVTDIELYGPPIPQVQQIKLDSTLFYPDNLSASNSLQTHFNGIDVKDGVGLKYMIAQLTTSNAQANQKLDHQFSFDGPGSLHGADNDATQYVIYFSSSQNLRVVGLWFWHARIQLQLDFCLKPTVMDCMFSFADSVATIFTYNKLGYPGTNSGDQSNNVLEWHNRYYAKDGAYANTIYKGVSGSDSRDNTHEGGYPSYMVICDNDFSTVVMDFHLALFHIEAVATKAAIWYRSDKGYISIEGIYCQYAQTLFKGDFLAYNHAYIKDIPWLLPNTKFETNGGGIVFSGELPNTFNPGDAKWWNNGKVPDNWIKYGWSDQMKPEISASSLNLKGNITVNGKQVATASSIAEREVSPTQDTLYAVTGVAPKFTPKRHYDKASIKVKINSIGKFYVQVTANDGAVVRESIGFNTPTEAATWKATIKASVKDQISQLTE